MFNLEQAIAEWRRQMLAAGVKTPVPLEELEAHLRDAMQQKVCSGLDEQQAFAAAVREVGTGTRLKAEFGKIITTERTLMKQMFVTLVALFGTVFGGAMVLPQLGQWHRTGVFRAWPIILGSAILILAAALTLGLIKKYRHARGRRLISIGIVCAAIFYMIPLLQGFTVQRPDATGWAVCIFLALASVLFYGTCFLLNRNSPAPLTREG